MTFIKKIFDDVKIIIIGSVVLRAKKITPYNFIFMKMKIYAQTRNPNLVVNFIRKKKI